MKSLKNKLPREITRGQDGHASDVALEVIADGELALLDAATLDHVDACDACTARLGEAALLSLRVSGELRGRDAALVAAGSSIQAVAVPSRRPLPLLAIAAALAIAAFAGVPALLDASRDGSIAPEGLRVTSGIALRFLLLAARGAWETSTLAVVVQWSVAAFFVVVGLTIAARVSRRRSLEGEI